MHFFLPSKRFWVAQFTISVVAAQLVERNQKETGGHLLHRFGQCSSTIHIVPYGSAIEPLWARSVHEFPWISPL
jgi:hypothetical protein